MAESVPVNKHESNNPYQFKKRKEPVIRNVPAVTRAIAILRLLGRSDEPLGVNAIARVLELVPSTVLHILRALTAEGFVKFDDDSKLYELDLGVLSIAHTILQRNRFVPLLNSSLRSLASEFGMTMYGVQTLGLDHLNVVASATSPLPIRVQAEMGARFPSMISATGRCVVAFGVYDKSELKERFDKIKTPGTISFARWWKMVQETREKGYSFDDGNFMPGISILAVPIFKDAEVSYSLVAIGLSEQFSSFGVDTVVAEMCNTSAELGYVLEQTTG